MKFFAKTFRIFTFLTVMLSPFSIQAKTTKDITGQKDDGSFESSKVLLGESAIARENKVAGAAVDGGMVAGGINGFGLRAFYNHTEKFQLGLQYLKGRIDLASRIGDSLGSKIETADLSASLILLHGRFFVGNSFNIFSGIGQRTLNYDLKVSSTFDPSTFVRTTGQSVANVVGFGIGNQWAWDSGFFIGGDWLAYYLSFGSSNSYSSETGGIPSDSQKKLANDAKDLSDALGKAGHFQITATAGWMF